MKRGIQFLYLFRHFNLTPVRNLDCTSSLQPAPVLLHLPVWYCRELMCLAQGHNTCRLWGSNPGPLRHSTTTRPHFLVPDSDIPYIAMGKQLFDQFSTKHHVTEICPLFRGCNWHGGHFSYLTWIIYVHFYSPSLRCSKNNRH